MDQANQLQNYKQLSFIYTLALLASQKSVYTLSCLVPPPWLTDWFGSGAHSGAQRLKVTIQETHTCEGALLSSKWANRQSLLQRLHSSPLLPSQLSVVNVLCDLPIDLRRIACFRIGNVWVNSYRQSQEAASSFLGCVTSPSKLGRASVDQLWYCLFWEEAGSIKRLITQCKWFSFC